tara:strand:- start:5674 stop:5976 length:303 start_codon:yes stop_codon:yes gene_type:complete
MMKSGANQSDQNDIRKMHEAGREAESISKVLQIDLPVVEGFCAHFTEEAKKAKSEAEKAKAAAEKAAAEAKAEAEKELRAEIRAEIEAELKKQPAKTVNK